ncbi:MAG: lactonase family protein [Planctomycetales bacterium]|nr:lactonase family protein [Planctomycetales bacterium]
MSRASASQVDVWIGTTTPGGGMSQGIYYAQLDLENGRLSVPQLAAKFPDPGFLAVHPQLPVLFSTGSSNGEAVVASWRIGERGPLTLLSTQAVGDGGATHLGTDRSGRVLLTAQYGGGSAAIFPVDSDGRIGPRGELYKHGGGSRVVEGRQDEPHAHWIGTSPDNRFVFVPDLGMDQVVIYRLHVDPPTLAHHGSGVCPPGGGPRHMKFHPSGKFIYVLNELALTVTTFAYDTRAGTMTEIQTVPTVSEAAKAKEQFVSASEIRVHPTGAFVYAANRGHDTISVFQIHPDRGTLTWVENEPIRGSWPRNFNVAPSGQWLVAAGRDSHSLTLFSIDSSSGELTYARQSVFVPTPICVTFGAQR